MQHSIAEKQVLKFHYFYCLNGRDPCLNLPVFPYQCICQSPQCDAIALRYKRRLVQMPSHCDGCDGPTDVSHALCCRRGGLVIRRHNEVGFTSVIKEPIVREGDLSGERPRLGADLAVKGLWQPQTSALFDVRVVDTDAQSYSGRPVEQVIQSAEEEKKLKYVEAVEERVFSTICSFGGWGYGERG